MMTDHFCVRSLLPMGMFGAVRFDVLLSQRAGLLLSTHSCLLLFNSRVYSVADWLAPVSIRIRLDTILTVSAGLGQSLSFGYLPAMSTGVSNIEQAVDTLYCPSTE
ncbi:BQ5605_C002g01020 [Microbotryum silenes-dioicae]|uniref:BQ5605_C002g01020 protein n=1 Tax=Microbotryum silenes-dioicae TaxID=796604 RepID=A0A2X0M232_9BASI|nr:BQ5605_C002g01020 [Microbotryum silenes-dioicae]